MDPRHDVYPPDDDDEPIDPRIQEELERLNTATDEINKLETELDEARARFRSTLSESTQRLNQLYKKYKRHVDKARPYYEARKDAKSAQEETMRAVRDFQRSNSIYKAAKETIALAEDKLVSEEGRNFDSAWQEMLNHATMKVNEAERERAKSEQNHHKRATTYELAQQKVLALEKKYKKAVSSSRPYFEQKVQLETQLEQQKQNVMDLEKAVKGAKQKYSDALKNLERISEEVHLRRKSRMASLQLPPREPGVGAESDSNASSLPDINLDYHEDVSVATSGALSDDELDSTSDFKSMDFESSNEFMPTEILDPSAKNKVTFVLGEDDSYDPGSRKRSSKIKPPENLKLEPEDDFVDSLRRVNVGDGCSETETTTTPTANRKLSTGLVLNIGGLVNMGRDMEPMSQPLHEHKNQSSSVHQEVRASLGDGASGSELTPGTPEVFVPDDNHDIDKVFEEMNDVDKTLTADQLHQMPLESQ